MSPSPILEEAGSSQLARRRLGRRLSVTHILIAIVVILAFVLNLLVLQDRDSTVLVAVTDQVIAAGSIFDPELIRLEPVDSGFVGTPKLVNEDNIGDLAGSVFTRTVPAGSPVALDSLGIPGAANGLRTMSLPVAIEHAAGGALSEGDQVDVIAVEDGAASFVASGLEVVGVSDTSGGAIGSSSGYHVVVAVDAIEALSLAEALESGSIEIVRATGASPLKGGAANGS